MENNKKLFRFATNPLVITISIILGFLIGMHSTVAMKYLYPIGKSYMLLLMMCILPIIFTTIISGLARLLKQRALYRKIIYWAIISICGILLTSALGSVVGMISAPNIKLSPQSEHSIGKLAKVIEYHPQAEKSKARFSEVSPLAAHGLHSKLSSFLHQITPSNIFAALSEGINIKSIFIAFILGIALGKIRGKISANLITLLDSIHDLFNQIFKWLLYLLPIGLLFLYTQKVVDVNTNLLQASVNFILLIYAVSLFSMIVYNFVIAKSTRTNFFTTFGKFKKALFLAFATESVYVPIPASLAALQELNMDAKIIGSVFPLGVIIAQYGKVLQITLLTMLSANFYGIHLGIHQIVTLTIIAAIVTTAFPGRIAMLASVFTAITITMGIPGTLGILLLSIMDPFTTRLQSTLTVQGNCMAAALCVRQAETKQKRKKNKTVINVASKN